MQAISPIHSAQLNDIDSIHRNVFLEHSSFSFEHTVRLWKFPRFLKPTFRNTFPSSKSVPCLRGGLAPQTIEFSMAAVSISHPFQQISYAFS